MTQFGRRLVPPGESLRKVKKTPAAPDVEQVKGWFDEARAHDVAAPVEPLTTRVARMLGLRRNR